LEKNVTLRVCEINLSVVEELMKEVATEYKTASNKDIPTTEIGYKFIFSPSNVWW